MPSMTLCMLGLPLQISAKQGGGNGEGARLTASILPGLGLMIAMTWIGADISNLFVDGLY